ncbi:MAG: phosphoglycerate mutase [Candidatus Binatia bacterium]|nr:MAG: phosphoglycerate mutase [Candidatus Binatia bacterium]
MPLRFFLVRHGLTDWNEERRLLGRTEIPLNRRGLAQARSLARALARVPPGRVFASPRRRARETAEEIARSSGLVVETAPELDEVRLGRWLGKTVDELQDDEDLRRYLEDPTYECDAIEPAREVRDRVVAFVERLRQNPPAPDLVLVSHGDPLRVLVSHYLGIELREYRRLRIFPGSVTLLEFDGARARVPFLGWKSPFAKLLADLDGSATVRVRAASRAPRETSEARRGVRAKLEP